MAAFTSEIASEGLAVLRDAYRDALAIAETGSGEAEELCRCLATIADDTSVDAVAAHVGMSPGEVPAYAISAIGPARDALSGISDVVGPVLSARADVQDS